MYLNKINLFLAISICLIFSFLIYNDVKSEEVKIISGIAESQSKMGTSGSHTNNEKVFVDSGGGHYTSDGKYHYDSDGDGITNDLDDDDDGDGIPTALEDANGNGDPTDDDADPLNVSPSG